MPTRLALNGYGRIGQSVLRALYESGYRDRLQVVAINELADPDTIAYLTRYDTTHGRFEGQVERENGHLRVNGDRIRLISEEDPGALPWAEAQVDLVLECTGAFSDRATAARHLHSGARRVLFSQPADPDVDLTVVYGINHGDLRADHRIVSNASCTTNCIVPVLAILDQHFGIERGLITTIHSAMNDQPVIDAYHHKDLRRTRSAMASMIPVNTELARGIERVLPRLTGRLQANAVRVPVINVSMMDLSVSLRTPVSVEAINACLKAAAEGPLQGILGYTEEPLASCDYNHDSRSGIVDGGLTRVSGDLMVKVMIWFDNEWAYATRMLDTAAYWSNLVQKENDR